MSHCENPGLFLKMLEKQRVATEIMEIKTFPICHSEAFIFNYNMGPKQIIILSNPNKEGDET